MSEVSVTDTMGQAKCRFYLGGHEHMTGDLTCCGNRVCGLNGCPGLVHSQILNSTWDDDYGVVAFEYDDCCDVCG